jgi:hypothetical protein
MEIKNGSEFLHQFTTQSDRIDFLTTYTILQSTFYALLALLLTISAIKLFASIRSYYLVKGIKIREEVRAMAKAAAPTQPSA